MLTDRLYILLIDTCHLYMTADCSYKQLLRQTLSVEAFYTQALKCPEVTYHRVHVMR